MTVACESKWIVSRSFSTWAWEWDVKGDPWPFSCESRVSIGIGDGGGKWKRRDGQHPPHTWHSTLKKGGGCYINELLQLVQRSESVRRHSGDLIEIAVAPGATPTRRRRKLNIALY